MIAVLSGGGLRRGSPTGFVEGLQTRLACWWLADAHDADGTGEVSKHYPQAEGTRPVARFALYNTRNCLPPKKW